MEECNKKLTSIVITAVFFLLLAISIAVSFYKYIVLEDYKVFLPEESIPE